MKKIVTSTIFTAVFTAYALYQYFGNSNTAEYVASNAAYSARQVKTQALAQSAPASVPPPVPAPAAASVAAPVSRGYESEGNDSGESDDSGERRISRTRTTAAAPAAKNNVPAAQKPAPVSVPVPVQTPPPAPISAPAPAPKSVGQYADGTYTGTAADAYYGIVQVKATVSGGKISDIAFLQYPSDRSHSLFLSNMAMPILKSEAIQAQNAHVNTVSGASETSAAFRESLTSALAQAKS